MQRARADTDTAGGIPLELKQHLNRPVSDPDADPLVEWASLNKLYPHVYEVALEYLGILATSVPSERLFSRAGQLITKERNRLSGQHVEQILFMQSVDEATWFDKYGLKNA